jgi:hypothetical protein
LLRDPEEGRPAAVSGAWTGRPRFSQAPALVLRSTVPHHHHRHRSAKAPEPNGRDWLANLLCLLVLLPVPAVTVAVFGGSSFGNLPAWQGAPVNDADVATVLRRPFLRSDIDDFARLYAAQKELEAQADLARARIENGEGPGCAAAPSPVRQWAATERIAWRAIYRLDYLFGFGF